MLPLIVFVGALAGVWYLEYWPFDRSYGFLPKHGEKRHEPCARPLGGRPVSLPDTCGRGRRACRCSPRHACNNPGPAARAGRRARAASAVASDGRRCGHEGKA